MPVWFAALWGGIFTLVGEVIGSSIAITKRDCTPGQYLLLVMLGGIVGLVIATCLWVILFGGISL
jgi:hypothetical protein